MTTADAGDSARLNELERFVAEIAKSLPTWSDEELRVAINSTMPPVSATWMRQILRARELVCAAARPANNATG